MFCISDEMAPFLPKPAMLLDSQHGSSVEVEPSKRRKLPELVWVFLNSFKRKIADCGRVWGTDLTSQGIEILCFVVFEEISLQTSN